MPQNNWYFTIFTSLSMHKCQNFFYLIACYFMKIRKGFLFLFLKFLYSFKSKLSSLHSCSKIVQWKVLLLKNYSHLYSPLRVPIVETPATATLLYLFLYRNWSSIIPSYCEVLFWILLVQSNIVSWNSITGFQSPRYFPCILKFSLCIESLLLLTCNIMKYNSYREFQ